MTLSIRFLPLTYHPPTTCSLSTSAAACVTVRRCPLGPGRLFNRFHSRKKASKNEGTSAVSRTGFINLTLMSKIYELSEVWFTVDRNGMEEKCASFFLFHKQKWNMRRRVICNWICIKCLWSSGYVWCISLDQVVLEHQFLSPWCTKKIKGRNSAFRHSPHDSCWGRWELAALLWKQNFA